MATPDHFFIIGAQRSGTTLLYDLLDQHPDIEMAQPKRPEPKFFLNAENVAKGRGFYEDKHFSGPAKRIRGEKSTSYIEYPQVGRRIRELYPEAKIVVMLRDPVERAVSNYHFSVKNGLEHRPIDQAILQEEKDAPAVHISGISTSPFAYLRRGLYSRYLNAYADIFPRTHIKILVYEQFVRQIRNWQDLLQFLGASTDLVPKLWPSVRPPEPKAQAFLKPETYAHCQAYFQDEASNLQREWNITL